MWVLSGTSILPGLGDISHSFSAAHNSCPRIHGITTVLPAWVTLGKTLHLLEMLPHLPNGGCRWYFLPQDCWGHYHGTCMWEAARSCCSRKMYHPHSPGGKTGSESRAGPRSERQCESWSWSPERQSLGFPTHCGVCL